LQFPAALAKAKAQDPDMDAHRPGLRAKAYHPDGRYIVIGSGIASINEWANALDTGAKVIASGAILRRTSRTQRARCLFEALGSTSSKGSRSTSA
jgi:hypothetical protein